MAEEFAMDFAAQIMATIDSKNLRYDQVICKKLLTKFGQEPPEDDNDMNLTWFNQAMGDRCAFGAIKLEGPFNIYPFITGKNINKQAPMVEYEHLVEDYPSSIHHYVVFDNHGDGIPDLVLHSDPTCIKEELNGSGWYLNLFYKKFGHMFIHPFSDFLQAVSL